MESEYAVIGGGVVGLSVAYGLLRRERSVVVFDEGDDVFRASRGNFGLIWVSMKGFGAPSYAQWTRRSARAWKEFAAEIEETLGESLALRQDGGYAFQLTEAELEAEAARYEEMRRQLDGDYPFEVLGHNALKREEPGIGDGVAGAILHHEDGHVNPLRLLHGLAAEVGRLGGVLRRRARIAKAEHRDGAIALTTAEGREFRAAKVVLCAGLGATALGQTLGFRAPIRPQRGQVLITEKLPKLMNRPSGIIRQVDEGGVQIGDSQEEVGPDDRDTLATTAAIAKRAVTIYPALARARLVRSWAALRVMSPDGLPIYQQSATVPGAYLVTCHSGVTLAAAHALFLPAWLDGDDDAPDLEAFGEHRFPV